MAARHDQPLPVLSWERQPSTSPPWNAGVSDANKAAAQRHYAQGNVLFSDEKYSDALGEYLASLKLWRHPRVHYNAAECLINIGRNLEAYHHLQAALRHGPTALGRRLHRQARAYLRILDRSLARLSIRCSQRRVKVLLDGKPLPRCPLRLERLLPPGVHAVVASRRGYTTMTRQLTVPAGRTTRLDIELVRQPPHRVVRQRIRYTWLPWLVLGAGLATAATALPLYLVARHRYAGVESDFATLCGSRFEGGCAPATLDSADERAKLASIEAAQTRAGREYRAAMSLLLVGGAVAAAGVVLVVLNIPHTALVRVRREHTQLRAPRLTPLVGPSLAGVHASWRF